MSKLWKGFLCGLALVAVGILTTACPKKPKPQVNPNTATQATDTAPNVDIPTNTAPTASTVPEPRDFVQTDTRPQVEELPLDIEGANRVAQERGYIKDAFFGYDEAALSSDAQAALTASATWLKNNPKYNLLVEGHCDERGTEQYNLALGDRRANTVKDYLAALGVDSSRMRTVSYGEERPFDPGHEESSWSQNRRAHLVLVGNR
ncbi:MAG: peptidoglycan-associated lipoprotein Pal [Acidobacteria bacterium]|nr:peptidoglycan-associated lipoprotein Pal [Acidobacteriota bacterium]